MLLRLTGLVLALAAANVQAAVKCETDQDCLSAGLSLIKKARRLGTCGAQVDRAAGALERVAKAGPELQELDSCVSEAQYEAKVQKRASKRLERIKKALDTAPKTSAR